MDDLSTYASIAASLVGFTGLLTAFRASTDSLSPNDVTNIRILLIFSVSALVFALLPVPILKLQNGEPWVRAVTVLLGAQFLFWSFQSPRWIRSKGIKPRNPRLYWLMIVIQAAIGAAVLLAGLLLVDPMPAYSMGVLWCLLSAIIVFVIQIFVMLPLSRNS